MTTTPVDLLAPQVSVAGSALNARQLEALVSVRVELGLCVVGRATLRFTDVGYALSSSRIFPLGVDVVISVPGKGTLIAGQVTGVTLEQSAREHPELVVVVDDAGHRLARGAKPATFLNSSYGDVVRKVAQIAGLSVDVPADGGFGTVSEYLLQTGPALSYLERITERTGTVWWVEGKKLVVKRAGTSIGEAQTTLGEDLLEFSVRASGHRATQVAVSGWDYVQQQPVVGQNATHATPDADFVAGYIGTAPARGLTTAMANTAEPAATSQSEADVLASALYDEAASAAVVGRGTCHVNAALKPAVTVKVKNAGPASGSYYVSEVEHTYSHRGFRTRFVAGPRRPQGLVDTLTANDPDPGFTIAGLVVGVVTNNRDEKNYGRVKVKFPALSGSIESAWARVITVGAGAQRGAVFPPEVGDEVLVGFEFGDSRRPVVIGGLFSPKNSLPEADKLFANGKVGYRRITSRRNHVIEFADGDTPQDQHILIKLGTAEHLLRLGSDALVMEVAQGKPITIKAGSAQLAITEAGDVSIAGNNISIKAKMALNLEGASGATLKTSGQLGIQGGMVEVQAQSTATVNGSAAVALKGGTVSIN